MNSPSFEKYNQSLEQISQNQIAVFTKKEVPEELIQVEEWLHPFSISPSDGNVPKK